MNRTVRPAFHLVAFAGAIAVAASVAVARSGPRWSSVVAQISPSSPTTETPAGDSLRRADVEFLVEAVQTGRAEAELSRLGVSQANASGVRELAQQLVADYADINRSLENLARRKAVELPVQPTSNGEATRALGTRTGTAFDRAYIEAVGAASSRALRLCEAAVAHARDPDIRAFAGGLLPTLRDHVNKIAELAKAL